MRTTFALLFITLLIGLPTITAQIPGGFGPLRRATKETQQVLNKLVRERLRTQFESPQLTKNCNATDLLF